MSSTMFERYGGFAKISRVVSAFYDKVLESDILSPYFLKTDMRRLIDHQTKFIASLMGGPASYSDSELERIHAHLKITDEAFEEMQMLMCETLEDFDFADEDVALVGEAIARRKRFITTA